jgi:hypothetical protein
MSVRLGLVAAALLAVVLAGVAWPKLSAERERAVDAAHVMAGAAVPLSALEAAQVGVWPGTAGWTVVFRDALVPCGQTELCRGGGWLPGSSVIRDVLVCVEYGTGRAYAIVGKVNPVGSFGNDCAQLQALRSSAGRASMAAGQSRL